MESSNQDGWVPPAKEAQRNQRRGPPVGRGKPTMGTLSAPVLGKKIPMKWLREQSTSCCWVRREERSGREERGSCRPGAGPHSNLSGAHWHSHGHEDQIRYGPRVDLRGEGGAPTRAIPRALGAETCTSLPQVLRFMAWPHAPMGFRLRPCLLPVDRGFPFSSGSRIGAPRGGGGGIIQGDPSGNALQPTLRKGRTRNARRPACLWRHSASSCENGAHKTRCGAERE